MFRKLVIAGIVIAILVMPVLLRVALESRAALEGARAAVARGDIETGFTGFEAAVRWSAPFHPYGVVAREELLAVVRSPERTVAERLRGLELLVSALETSRHALSMLDARRTEILIDAQAKLQELRGADTYAVRPTTPPRIRYLPQLLAQFLFWGWVVLAGRLVWQGFDDRGKAQWRTIKRSALPIVIAYALWLVALRLA